MRQARIEKLVTMLAPLPPPSLYLFDVIAAGLIEVIIYSSPDDKKKNRGFCFLEYESHKAASLAKRRLGTGRIKVCNPRLLRVKYFTIWLTFNVFISNIIFLVSRFGAVI